MVSAEGRNAFRSIRTVLKVELTLMACMLDASSSSVKRRSHRYGRRAAPRGRCLALHRSAAPERLNRDSMLNYFLK